MTVYQRGQQGWADRTGRRLQASSLYVRINLLLALLWPYSVGRARVKIGFLTVFSPLMMVKLVSRLLTEKWDFSPV